MLQIEQLFETLALTEDKPEEPPRGIQPTGEESSHESDPCWCTGC